MITERDIDVLGELAAANRNHVDLGFLNGWARPLDCGGSHPRRDAGQAASRGAGRPARLPPGHASCLALQDNPDRVEPAAHEEKIVLYFYDDRAIVPTLNYEPEMTS